MTSCFLFLLRLFEACEAIKAISEKKMEKMKPDSTDEEIWILLLECQSTGF